MNERGELRANLLDDHGYCVNCGEDAEDCECAFDEFIDAILAAGYRKPRTITTVEELDDLGRNAAVLAANGAVLVNDGENDVPWASFAEDALGGPVWIDPVDVKLPATVLYVPEES